MSEPDKSETPVAAGEIPAEPMAAALDTLQAEIDKLREELAQAKEGALRAQAEMQNVRRRAEQDIEKAHKYAVDRFAGDIISVADNLERALTTVDRLDERQKALIEGVDLTLKSLLDTLGRHGIQQIDPQGLPFDPQLHEAIAMVPSATHPANQVLEVMQRGYTLNGRLLRPARVVVTKEPS